VTATNHALTGAAIALIINEPVLAIPVAFLSHYVIDVLPHFGIPGSIKERNKSLLGRVVVLVDAFCFITSLIVLPLLAHRINVNPWLVLACMLAAFAPDAVYLIRFPKELKTGEFIKGGVFSRFHRKIQLCERPWGILVEVVFMGLMLIFLAKKLY
jgi:hypothetical protein